MSDEAPLQVALAAHAEQHPTEGFWKAYGRLRLQGKPWNHKRLWRVYTAMGLALRRKKKKRLPARVKHPLEFHKALNHT